MKKPLKILYLITKSNYGGAQKYIYELAKQAKAEGHEVQVAAGGTGFAGAPVGILMEKLSAASIKTHVIKNFLRDISFFSDIKAIIEIYKLIKKVKPDVLHLTSSKAGGIGVLAGRLAGVSKIIFTSHGLTTDEVWRPRWQQILIYISTWITIRLSHQSIMISTDTFKRAKNMPWLKNQVTLIKNGIAAIDFAGRAEARASLAPQLSPESIWIGGMGELHPNKNWSTAIEAMVDLPPKTHLLIIGEGEEKLKLKTLINQHSLNNRVHLLGYLDGAKYLKAFDIFILPSIKEGLPYVLLEAGLAQLPTVATDLPGNRDIIANEKNGLLVNPDVKQISVAIKKMLQNPQLAEAYALDLNKKIITDFSIQKMYHETIALYKN